MENRYNFMRNSAKRRERNYFISEIEGECESGQGLGGEGVEGSEIGKGGGMYFFVGT